MNYPPISNEQEYIEVTKLVMDLTFEKERFGLSDIPEQLLKDCRELVEDYRKKNNLNE